jgi:serine/threonine protein kinase
MTLGTRDYDLADVWSAGVTYLELLTGVEPFFWATNADQVIELYSKASVAEGLKTRYGPYLGPEALAFFQYVLQVDPKERPPAWKVLKHPYLKKYWKQVEVLQKAGEEGALAAAAGGDGAQAAAGEGDQALAAAAAAQPGDEAQQQT